jgi:hypothetical protein
MADLFLNRACTTSAAYYSGKMDAMKLLKWGGSVLLTTLLTAVFTALLLRLAFEWQSQSAQTILPSVQDALMLMQRFLIYIGFLITTLFPWPFVILVGLYLLFRSPSAFVLIVGIMRLLRKIKLLGAEVELTEQTRRQIRGAARDLETALAEYREEINIEIERYVSRQQFDSVLKTLAEDIIKNTLPGEQLPAQFRCTIHIADLVIRGHLYQMLNYYPDGTGRGRSFSERYGIIGKVWRSQKSIVVNTLLANIPANASNAEKTSKITEDWGMTQDEAGKALKRPSYASCVILHENRRLGVFYMDSTKENAFPDEQKVAALLEKGVSDLKIGEKVSKLYERSTFMNSR